MKDQIEDRWKFAQIKEEEFWRRPNVIDFQNERIASRYSGLCQEIAKQLPPGAAICDVGCGPTCAARYFENPNTTYVDPLMDAYIDAYSDELPVGNKVSCGAEEMPFPDNNFDVVVSFNALDHMISPEKALKEICRVVKSDGIFVLGIFLHSELVVTVHNIIERYLPFFREDAHPYSFSRKSMRALLSKEFDIEQELCVYKKDKVLLPAFHREDWMYICKKK